MASGNAQKTPIARTLNQFVERKARGLIDLLGKALPATVVSRSGTIVTVKFEIVSPYTLPNVTLPMIGSEYIRLPIQPGCPGWVIPSDAYLGGMSGLGGGTADLSMPANLSSLVWSPIGNANLSSADDDDAVVIYGPDGVILRDMQSRAVATIGPTSITLQVGSISIVIDGTNITFNGPTVFNGVASGPTDTVDFGSSAVKTTGAITAGSVKAATIDLATHEHSAVTTGTGVSGPPVP